MVHSRGFVNFIPYQVQKTTITTLRCVDVLSIGQIFSHIDCGSHLFWQGVVPVQGDLELRAMPVIPQLRLTKTGDRIIYKNGIGVLGWSEDFPFLDSFTLQTLS